MNAKDVSRTIQAEAAAIDLKVRDIVLSYRGWLVTWTRTGKANVKVDAATLSFEANLKQLIPCSIEPRERTRSYVTLEVVLDPELRSKGAESAPDAESPSEEDIFAYLDSLRDSGITNMFGCEKYLMNTFDLDKAGAREWAVRWMKQYRAAHTSPSSPEPQEDTSEPEQPQAPVRSREDILRKAEALLRMNEDENASDNERQMAWDRLEALLVKHAIRLSELAGGSDEPDLFHELVPIGESWEQRAWRSMLVNAVAHYTLTKGYTVGSTQALFVGRKLDVQVAGVMLTGLLTQLRAAYKRDAKATTDKGMDGMAWKKVYLVSAAERINERARAAVKTTDPQSMALITLSDTSVKQYVEEQFGKTSRRRNNLRVKINGNRASFLDAADKGRQAGNDAQFEQGIEDKAGKDAIES